MPSYDLLMLLIVVATTLWGLWKGFAWQLASLGSIFSSYGVAWLFRAPVAQMIDADPPWNMFAAMLIIYLLSSVGIWIGFGLVSEGIANLRLKDFDRQLGGMFGAAQGALLCVLVTFFGVTLLPPRNQEAICQSRAGRYIAVMLRSSGGLIPPEVASVVDPLLKSFQERLEQQPVIVEAADPPQGYAGPAGDHRQVQNYGPAAGWQYDPQAYDRRYEQPGYYDPRYADPRSYQTPYRDPRYAYPQYSDPYYQAQPSYAPRQPPAGQGPDPRTSWR